MQSIEAKLSVGEEDDDRRAKAADGFEGKEPGDSTFLAEMQIYA